MALLTSVEQARLFFRQPHVGVPTTPIDSPAAWSGAELNAQAQDWRYSLSPAECQELLTAVASTQGLPLAQIQGADFPLPTLGPKARQWAAQVNEGRGFQLIEGLPVQRWTEAESQRAFWGLGQHLGNPGPQNPEGELLGHVKDYGERTDRPEVRLYRTAANIRYHCDAADMVGLLCLQPAASGGASRLVSSVTIFNEILRREPTLIPTLFEPFLIDSRGEQAPGAKPWNELTPCAWSGSQLHTFFHSDYFRSVRRHSEAPAISQSQARLLDLFEEIGNDPHFYLDMNFAAGDLQLVSNHRVLHARTAYTDATEPNARRHLLRLWLSADPTRAVTTAAMD